LFFVVVVIVLFIVQYNIC